MVKQKEENPQSYREGMERSLISVEIIAKRAGFCEMSTEKKKNLKVCLLCCMIIEKKEKWLAKREEMSWDLKSMGIDKEGRVVLGRMQLPQRTFNC